MPKAMQDPRKEGGRYFCGYWRQEYTVLDTWRGECGTVWYTVKWDDEHQTTHCTPWDSRRDHEVLSHDQKVALAEVYANQRG